MRHLHLQRSGRSGAEIVGVLPPRTFAEALEILEKNVDQIPEEDCCLLRESAGQATIQFADVQAQLLQRDFGAGLVLLRAHNGRAERGFGAAQPAEERDHPRRHLPGAGCEEGGAGEQARQHVSHQEHPAVGPEEEGFFTSGVQHLQALRLRTQRSDLPRLPQLLPDEGGHLLQLVVQRCAAFRGEGQRAGVVVPQERGVHRKGPGVAGGVHPVQVPQVVQGERGVELAHRALHQDRPRQHQVHRGPDGGHQPQALLQHPLGQQNAHQRQQA